MALGAAFSHVIGAGVPADSVEVLQDPAHTETGVQVDRPVGGHQGCLVSLSRVCAQHDPLLPELIHVCDLPGVAWFAFEGLALLIRSSVFARHCRRGCARR